jgi:sodium transport system permease protein
MEEAEYLCDRIAVIHEGQLRIIGTVLEPFVVDKVDVAPEGKKGKTIIGGMVGYMVILLMFSGCMYPSLDMTAGEKERRTLEILLASPATREEIVLAKVMAASTAAFITGMLNVLSLGYTFTSWRRWR